jgi:hypothetical protein
LLEIRCQIYRQEIILTPIKSQGPIQYAPKILTDWNHSEFQSALRLSFQVMGVLILLSPRSFYIATIALAAVLGLPAALAILWHLGTNYGKIPIHSCRSRMAACGRFLTFAAVLILPSV